MQYSAAFTLKLKTNESNKKNIIKNKKSTPAKLKFRHLSELGSRLNLSFSSHDVIGDKIIGLDGMKKKLLIAQKNNVLNQSRIIELDEVKAISIKKVYNGIIAGALRKRSIGEFLKTMVIQFELKHKNELIILPFYESVINKLYDLTGLERKARNWQLMLSKMISTHNY